MKLNIGIDLRGYQESADSYSFIDGYVVTTNISMHEVRVTALK